MSNQITQTTLSSPINQLATLLNLASVTNIVAPTNQGMQKIYVINPGTMVGELMTVSGAVNGNYVPVSRLDGQAGAKQSFATGSIVLIAPFVANAPLGGFYADNPYGDASVVGNTGQSNNTVITPWVNVNTGQQWLQDVNGIWVPGWNNPLGPGGPTAAVASAAGLVTPSGRLFHITGNLAITGFNIPIGFAGGFFDVIPDGTFTWTAANNIALLGTAVVSKTIRFTYDTNSALFYPSVVA